METALISETFKDGIWTSSFHHTDSIQALVKGLNPVDFVTLLRLSSSALTHLHSSASTLKYKEALSVEIEAHTQKIKDSAKKEKDADASHYTMEVTRLKATLEELQIQNKSLKSQFAELHEKNQETFRSSIAAMKIEKDEQYSREINRMREDMKERVLELQKIYAEASAKTKKETSVSSEIGKKGERDFQDLVSDYTSWGTLVKTSDIPHNADWACMIRKTNTLFEIKNYSSDVPTREVTKFEDDMKLHSDVHFGAFLSMNTSICGKRFDKTIVIDWTSNAQMLVYISCFRQQDLPAMFMFLDMCADIAYRCYRLIQDRPDDSEACLQLERKIQGVQVLIERELVSLSGWLRDFKSEHQVAMDHLTKQYNVNLGRIAHTKTSLMSILEIMTGAVEEKIEEKEKEKEKEPVKKKTKKIQQ
jgi:hypothetical protein